MPFDTHSTQKMPNLAIMKKFKVFFEKNSSISSKKTWILLFLFLRNCTNSVAVYGICATICRENFTFKNVNGNPECNWQRSVRKCSIWEEDFSSIFYKYGGKFMKHFMSVEKWQNFVYHFSFEFHPFDHKMLEKVHHANILEPKILKPTIPKAKIQKIQDNPDQNNHTN